MRQRMRRVPGWPAFTITPDIAVKLKAIRPASIDPRLKKDKDAIRLKGKSPPAPFVEQRQFLSRLWMNCGMMVFSRFLGYTI